MKAIATTSFNLKALFKLNALVLNNRKEYVNFQNYGVHKEIYFPKKGVDPSWRHPEVILDTLQNKKYRKYDVIINTGQRNIVTNYNVDVLDKMLCHLNPLKHKMVLQSWWLDPDLTPLVPSTEYDGGPIIFKKINEPHLVLASE
jgi:hypothetical protein